QAEDGIRDFHVTGVQTCALPIYASLTASLNTLGELLRRAGRLDEAYEIDLLAIGQDPESTSQVFVMGNTYFNAGRTEEAIAIYRSEERRVGRECGCSVAREHRVK